MRVHSQHHPGSYVNVRVTLLTTNPTGLMRSKLPWKLRDIIKYNT